MKRIALALMASAAVAAPLAAIPSSAGAVEYVGTVLNYPEVHAVWGPGWVGDMYTLDRNWACYLFGGPPSNLPWENPCPGGPSTTICDAVITERWEMETPWYCGQGIGGVGFGPVGYPEQGSLYGWIIEAAPYDVKGRWAYEMVNYG
jgi:hypothetical protein